MEKMELKDKIDIILNAFDQNTYQSLAWLMGIADAMTEFLKDLTKEEDIPTLDDCIEDLIRFPKNKTH